MKIGKKLAATTIAAIVALSSSIPVFAYGEMGSSGNTVPTGTLSDEAFTEWKSSVWDNGEKADSAKIALTPGETSSDLNFAWYSEAKTGVPAVRISKDPSMANATVFTGEALDINRTNMDGKTYTAANHVSVEGFFEENTTYYYSYNSDQSQEAGWSEPESYTTQSFSEFSAILVGDPQIGASSGTGLEGVNDIAVDTFNWNKTLEKAAEIAGDASFILSAGDQIDYSNQDNQDTSGRRESEYAGFLYPEVLRSYPIATTIGNHESMGTDYQYHYNNPNTEDDLGSTQAGSDYYFSYGDVLFIVLNTNHRNVSEHRALMQKAVDSNQDATWKIVMFHHDIYGSGEHSNQDSANLRILFAPLMDEFDIDVCLTGHDHIYSRTYQILDGQAIDYGTQNSVSDPEGTMYVTAGSASGSKVYSMVNTQQYYIAERTNNPIPIFSTIDFTENSLTIKTYDYNGNKYADDFTITKNVDDASLLELVDQAESMDTTGYTAGTVKAMNDAAAEVKTLLETQEDEGAKLLSDSYDESIIHNNPNPNDPLRYYAQAENLEGMGGLNSNYERQQEYQSVTEEIDQDTLRVGFSTLLDKTLLNLTKEKIGADQINAAYVKLNTAISNLAAQSDADELATAVAEAQKKHDAAVEGSQAGQYQPGSKAAFQEKIDAAAKVAENDAATATEIAEALASLDTATKTFDAAMVTETPGTGTDPDENNPQNPDGGNTGNNNDTDNNTDTDVPQTGDNSAGILFGLTAVVVISGAAVTILLLRKKVKKQHADQ